MTLIASLAFAAGLLMAPVDPASIRVIDGDTIMLRVTRERIRIIGVDTPELRGRCMAERERALRARERVVEWLGDAAIVTIERAGHDRYRRTLARVYVDGANLATLLIEARLGREYHGGRRARWC